MYACYRKYISYLSLTFLCEFRVYLSMEICKKKPQMEYLPTFLIHDPHLAKWEDYVNNKMIFKWNFFCVLVKNLEEQIFREHILMMWGLWLAAFDGEQHRSFKCLEDHKENRSCYALCQSYSYLRFQVSLNPHYFFFLLLPPQLSLKPDYSASP